MCGGGVEGANPQYHIRANVEDVIGPCDCQIRTANKHTEKLQHKKDWNRSERKNEKSCESRYHVHDVAVVNDYDRE